MHSLSKTYHIFRGFLFKLLNREFLFFLFFLALSGIFWLMMTLNETYEQEIPVGLRLTGIPKNVVMTTEMSDTAYITVRDKGFMLLSYITSSKLHPLTYNFSDYADRQTNKGQLSVADIQKSVRQQLFASTVITAIKAERLEFYFNYGLNKEVEVKLVGNVVPASNFYLSHVQFSPEKVVVYATKDKLDSIHSVTTEYQNIVNFDDTVVRKVRLKPIVGAKIVPSTISLTLYPDILTEESVEVPITAINKPEGLTVRTFPQKVKVRFTVGASMFRTIRPSDFQVVVDYREIAARPSDKCNLYLQSKPRGVSNAHLEIKQIDYLIEQ
ncbi:YbbR-like protein [Hallella bergensis DSM 17361]|uniref:YbbR-like protein n=2 Tax=Hallella bergensis TaxID=242750 RepID=D1PXG2_9BACT|nr:CdaR family protein [Hallella bergensis]EFA43929.1 YbbR-like protein [Hallella bergensis DSM 17361]